MPAATLGFAGDAAMVAAGCVAGVAFAGRRVGEFPGTGERRTGGEAAFRKAGDGESAGDGAHATIAAFECAGGAGAGSRIVEAASVEAVLLCRNHDWVGTFKEWTCSARRRTQHARARALPKNLRMNRQRNSGRNRPAQVSVASPTAVQAAQRGFSARDLFALVFGLFLGLATVKFGNPVILDEKIAPPISLAEGWSDPWPTHWANWVLALLALPGAWLAMRSWHRWRGGRGVWLLPPAWVGLQVYSATRTAVKTLTAATP